MIQALEKLALLRLGDALLLGELCIYLGYAMELLRYVAAEIITYKSGYAKMKL